MQAWGEHSPCAVLTEQAVREMREEYENGEFSLASTVQAWRLIGAGQPNHPASTLGPRLMKRAQFFKPGSIFIERQVPQKVPPRLHLLEARNQSDLHR